LSACRDVHQFRRLLPQILEIGRFRFRIINPLLGKLGRLWIALEHFESLLDCSRKTCGCIYEHIQRCIGKCRRSQGKENRRPKHMRPPYQTQWDDAKFCYSIITAHFEPAGIPGHELPPRS
jgi:hypothetical protein